MEFGPVLLRSFSLLYLRGFVFCVLCFMVFCDVGLVDRRCFSSSGPIRCFLVIGCLIRWVFIWIL